MIKITEDDNFNISAFMNKYPKGSIERKILDEMYETAEEYRYDDVKTLEFELILRKEIVDAAIDLNASRFEFAGFENSRSNEKYWDRMENGGFLLKRGVQPSEAINDIFINGEKYATECATAMMIVYYKALLNVLKEDLFDKTFKQIYLMDWDVREPLLKEVTDLKQTTNPLLGDRQYFNNPDFSPEFSEWRGENVIVLPNNLYYGHGIGITTGSEIINALNSKRKSNDSRTAYLMDVVGRPDFKKLSDVYYGNRVQFGTLVWKPFPEPIIRV